VFSNKSDADRQKVRELANRIGALVEQLIMREGEDAIAVLNALGSQLATGLREAVRQGALSAEAPAVMLAAIHRTVMTGEPTIAGTK
jgi:hypothetical protein